MALLEQIEKMKQSGQSENQIAQTLKEQGFPLIQVNEALSQSRIKSAVYGDSQSANGEELQPSIMQSESDINFSSPNQVPMSPVTQEVPNQQQEQYATDQGYYQDPNQQQGYEQQTYYSQAIDVETVRDIARQESEEIIKKIRQDVEALNKLKTDMKFEIQNMDNRLSKVEAIIQELQTAIIRKMGEYGEAISGISQEVQATQSAFTKMVNPLLDKQRGTKSEQEQQVEEQEQKLRQIAKGKPNKKAPNEPAKESSRSKDSASFEDYFR